mmetsp:Transcript_105930/g.338284  ORF Transcript_105930/g.338284 Transcript_105930/m.338284 type:complete len:210 (+) Transcript_105930:3281-3910(+)
MLSQRPLGIDPSVPDYHCEVERREHNPLLCARRGCPMLLRILRTPRLVTARSSPHALRPPGCTPSCPVRRPQTAERSSRVQESVRTPLATRAMPPQDQRELVRPQFGSPQLPLLPSCQLLHTTKAREWRARNASMPPAVLGRLAQASPLCQCVWTPQLKSPPTMPPLRSGPWRRFGFSPRRHLRYAMLRRSVPCGGPTASCHRATPRPR